MVVKAFLVVDVIRRRGGGGRVELHSVLGQILRGHHEAPLVEGLHGPEVVNDIRIIPVLQRSELCKLASGDLDRLEEVDPVDDLHAAGGGQGAGVGAVGGARGHASYQVCDLQQRYVQSLYHEASEIYQEW